MRTTGPALGAGRPVLAAGLLVASGCSDDGLGKRYPVSGTVTYNGKPLEKGQINFLPTAPDGRSASGDIQAGEYSLTTQTPGDGALPGKYRVTIIATDVDLTGAIAKQQGGIPSQEDVVKAQRKAKRADPGQVRGPRNVRPGERSQGGIEHFRLPPDRLR